jgi:MFS family permease
MVAGEFTQGIRANWRQFSLHVVLVFATGLTLGAERAVLPVLGRDVYGVASLAVIGTFVVSFGVVKAILNLTAGAWGETYGRKPVLILGWATALPLPVVLILAPTWEWIVAGNLLLGANQALTWSMAINAKIDLAGPDQRGLAVGIDEAFGYGGVAVGGWVTGVIAAEYALRPEPFYFLAAVVVLALALALTLIEETLPYAEAEARSAAPAGAGDKRRSTAAKSVDAAILHEGNIDQPLTSATSAKDESSASHGTCRRKADRSEPTIRQRPR